MFRVQRVIAAAVAAAVGASMPVAAADKRTDKRTDVTYEVVSDEIGTANIEYFDGSIRQSLQNVPLPWRYTVPVGNPSSWGNDVAEVRADWRWAAAPNRWVTTRILFDGNARCENTLDIGNVACYGTTPFDNF